MTDTALTMADTTEIWAATPDDTLERLGSRTDGLTTLEAQTARAAYGANSIPAAKRKPAIVRFLVQFNNVLIYILLVAGLVKAIFRDWVDFWVIVAVAVGNALIGFIQEGQAEKAIAGIRGMLSLRATVRRDGDWVDIDAADVVPGDIVRFGPGDKIPADIRLLSAQRLKIDESMLTGESEPVTKNVDAVPADAGIGDRTDVAHSGTVVTQGTGMGVVFATGTATEIGHIQKLVDDVDSLKTPLSRQLDRLGTQFAIGILIVSAVLLVLGRFVHDIPPESLLSFVLSFAVASVPEGLPALVTITLALGVQQMARHRAITRKMGAVETLGAVTTICSDKTGTLTRNEMTARVAAVPGGEYSVTGDGYSRAGTVVPVGEDSAPSGIAELAEIVALCNEAVVRENGEQWQVVGEPTEAALAIFAAKAGFDGEGYSRSATIPFDSAYKFMAVRTTDPAGVERVLVKGGPDVLFARCSTQLREDGAPEPFDLSRWEHAVETYASQGMRVLAAARAAAPEDEGSLRQRDVRAGLEFVGLVGLIDPPRSEAIAAIESCHSAGVDVKMITGDHVETAKAISRQLRLRGDDEPVAITGTEVEALSRAQLAARVREIDVFARTSPEHKIRIVDALQSHGQVVAMTGDGANDAPALTRADVGIAMGIKGTEATKEAADIVLADDNFATIERAIGEGRRIYDNILKSVVFLLPTTIAQGLIVFIAVLFGVDPPLVPTQILWVNLVTAVSLSVALAYEPAEAGIMQRPPRDPHAGLLAPWLWGRVIWIAVLIAGATMGVYYVMLGNGVEVDVARTTSVAVLVVSQIFVLFNSRFLYRSSLNLRALTGNPVVWISALSLIVLQLAFTYLPFMNTWFDSAPLTLGQWGIAVVCGAVIFLIIEAMKAIQNRLLTRRGALSG